MQTDPVFPQQPFNCVVELSAGSSALDGTGAVDFDTSSIGDSYQIDAVVIKAKGPTTLGMIRFFIKDNSAAYHLIDEVDVTAVPSPGATTKTFKTVWTPPAGFPQRMDGGNDWRLAATTENSENFELHLIAGY